MLGEQKKAGCLWNAGHNVCCLSSIHAYIKHFKFRNQPYEPGMPAVMCQSEDGMQALQESKILLRHFTLKMVQMAPSWRSRQRNIATYNYCNKTCNKPAAHDTHQRSLILSKITFRSGTYDAAHDKGTNWCSHIYTYGTATLFHSLFPDTHFCPEHRCNNFTGFTLVYVGHDNKMINRQATLLWRAYAEAQEIGERINWWGFEGS